MPYGDVHRITAQRIRRARETLDVIDRVLREPTRENIAALHEVHATHLRELGDQDGADRAQLRAMQTRRRGPRVDRAKTPEVADES